MSDVQLFTTANPLNLRPGDHLTAIGNLLVSVRVESVVPGSDLSAHVILPGGGIVTLPTGTVVSYGREVSTSGYGADDECLTCGEHISDPHAPDCSRFGRRVTAYAAKLAADSVLSEPPTAPDLTPAGIASALSGCGRLPKPAELDHIRDAFLAEYGDELPPCSDHGHEVCARCCTPDGLVRA